MKSLCFKSNDVILAINSEDSIIQGFLIHSDVRYNPTLTTYAHQEDTSQHQFPDCSLHPQGLWGGAGGGLEHRLQAT